MNARDNIDLVNEELDNIAIHVRCGTATPNKLANCFGTGCCIVDPDGNNPIDPYNRINIS